MNILQAHKYYWRRDGASKYVLDLSAELESEGHKVIPFAAKQQESLKSDFDKYFVEYFDLSSPEKYGLFEKLKIALNFIYSRPAKHNMGKLLKTQDVDIAHLHNIYHHISPSILPTLAKNGAKTVMTLHDYKLISPNYTMFYRGKNHPEDCQGWFLNCIKNKCMNGSLAQSMLVTLEMIIHHKIWRVYEKYVDQFITPSLFMKQKCVEFGWKEEKFSHIRNPVNTDKFEFSSKNGDYVTYIGRLSEEKGLLTLIDAAIQLSDIPFHITGSGPLEEKLKRKVKKEDADNITFDGFLSGQALKDRIYGSDIIVMPSVWYENYPSSVLEAKAAGRIPIASKIGGIPEMLPEQLLVEPKDSDMLARKIEEWFSKKESTKKQMRKTLREEVEQENDTQKHVERVLSVYKSL